MSLSEFILTHQTRRDYSQLLNLLFRSIQLDICWINYLWGEKPEHFRDTLGPAFRNRGFLRGVLKQLVKIFRSLVRRIRFKPSSPLSSNILFFADSMNQWRAFQPIREYLDDSSVCVDGDFEGAELFASDLARCISLFYIPAVLLQACSPRSALKFWTLSYGTGQFLDAYGYYVVGYRWLEKRRPKLLVISNDHGPQTRAIRLAAEELAIPTAYIQHAPITKEFPPLEFDYALLDGEISEERYQIKNKNCVTSLIGMTRRKPLSSHLERGPFAIGFGLNELDELPLVDSLVAEARKEFPEADIYLRPHPADSDERLESFQELAQKYSAKYSNPMLESSWHFLRELTFMVAGISAILLDAAFAGVVPVQHQKLSGGLDYYGFLEEKVMLSIESIADLKALAEDLPKVKNTIEDGLKRFDATFGTELDGKSPQLAAETLVSILSTLEKDTAQMTRKISYA